MKQPEIQRLPATLGRRRTRWGALALAVLLMAVGGLLSGFAFLASTRTRSCLAVSRAVPAGVTVTSADVKSVEVTVVTPLAPIPAERIRDAVGKRAAVSLVPGTLLTAAQLTDEPLVRSDQRQVGIGLPPERMPARNLHPGDQVQLVSTSDDGQSTTVRTAEAKAAVQRFDATVVDVSARAAAGVEGWVVYVAVAERDATQVVTLAAERRLSMVLQVGG